MKNCESLQDFFYHWCLFQAIITIQVAENIEELERQKKKIKKNLAALYDFGAQVKHN